MNGHYLGDDYQWHPLPPDSGHPAPSPVPGFGYFYKRYFGRTWLVILLPLWGILTVVKLGDEVFAAAIIDAALEAAWFGLLLALAVNCLVAAVFQNRTALAAVPPPALMPTLLPDPLGSGSARVTSQSDYSSLSRAELEERLAAAEPQTSMVPTPTAASAGSGRPRRRPSRLLIILGAAALLVVLLVVADWYERNRELGNLLDAVETSESAMNGAIRSFTGADSSLGSPPYTQEAVDDWEAKVLAASSKGAAAVLTTGDAIRDVRILPWHSSLKTAKARYLAHNKTWQVHLTAVANDPAELFTPHPEIGGTFTSAEAAFRKAVPMLALNDAEARIDEIFAE